MAYDHELAEQVRGILPGNPGLSEKKMFGGLAFLVGGHMAVVVSGQGGLMIRTSPERAQQLAAESPAYPAEMRGRAMKGWLRIDDETALFGDALRRWVDEGYDFARTLPPKSSQ